MLVYLASEDELSCAVGKKIIAEALPSAIIECPQQKGHTYLQQKLDGFLRLASHHFVIVLTDLDSAACPVELKGAWLRGKTVPEKFLLRIAVREIESWLLADSEGLSNFLGGRSAGKMCLTPEELDYPKEKMLQIAKSASREMMSDLVIVRRGKMVTGTGYNIRLRDFVNQGWCIRRAAERSESLRRAQRAISSLLT